MLNKLRNSIESDILLMVLDINNASQNYIMTIQKKFLKYFNYTKIIKKIR